MGRNLAAHLIERRTPITVYSYADDERTGFSDASCVAGSLTTFVASLAKPRKILLMVTAGEPVDRIVEDLLPHLSSGDIVIDGGNSHFEDTRRRTADLNQHGVAFVGLGISGGSAGARHGAAMMAGGPDEAVQAIRPVLEPLAAKWGDEPCFVHAGPDGAGHFVKMVHNGIEYGLMQLIAEVWDFLERGAGMAREDQAAMFRAFRGGPVSSYLIDITADVLEARDDLTSGWLLDAIDDRAGQKGTGRWTLEAALALGVPVPVIAAAVNERLLSSSPRGNRSADLEPANETTWALAIEQALLTGYVATFIQGIELLEAASRAYGWSVDIRAVARAWRAGCIVRANLLSRFVTSTAPTITEDFAELIESNEEAARRVLAGGIDSGIPMPALGAAVSWIDSKRSRRLPTRLIQAQRDYFGAHGYRRTDRSGDFSFDWQQE